MDWETIDPKEQLIEQVARNGGWVNAHTHIDRSYIINADNWHLTEDSLQAKWSHTDHFKASRTVPQILGHMSRVVESQLAQGVQALGSFIDCDSVVGDKNLQAAGLLRERYGSDLQLVFMNQPIKGLCDDKERAWFELAAEFVDIIGGLPERDSHDDPTRCRKNAHFDIVFGLAQSLGKPLHIHTDQLNLPSQRDTEIAIQKTKEYAYAGKVSLIHCISLAAQAHGDRQRTYNDLAEHGIGIITCPSAWIDSRRSEVLSPTHSAITPVDELLNYDISIALGTDNIADIYKPFSDGDMWTELRFLLETTHTYDLEALANIATSNGLKALNLQPAIAVS